MRFNFELIFTFVFPRRFHDLNFAAAFFWNLCGFFRLICQFLKLRRRRVPLMFFCNTIKQPVTGKMSNPTSQKKRMRIVSMQICKTNKLFIWHRNTISWMSQQQKQIQLPHQFTTNPCILKQTNKNKYTSAICLASNQTKAHARRTKRMTTSFQINRDWHVEWGKKL